MIIESIKFLKDVENFKKKTKEFCQTKSIPIDQRWEVFEKVGGYIGEEEYSVVDFESLPENFIMYEGGYMHVERYQTIVTTNIIERIKEEREDGNSKFSNINIDEVKEEILDKFLWSFEYDW